MRAPVFGQGLTAVFLLSACALQFNDPEVDLRRKISEPFPVSFSALVGRWEADSTYLTDDLSAWPLTGSGLIVDFFPDTTFALFDTGSLIFQPPGNGSFILSGNTLTFIPASGAIFTANSELTFLGNYLELYIPAAGRYTGFHRVIPPDTLRMDQWLRGERWQVVARRTGSGFPRAESLNTNFESAVFNADSFHWEINRHGLVTKLSGTFAATESSLTLSGNGIPTDWLPQWIDEDTLRLWPLRSGKPDSGFSILTRHPSRHTWDLDVSFLPRYWRGDSVLINGQWRELHFGDFYDLAPDSLHRISRNANSTGLPSFVTWDIDSGRVMLGESGKISAYTAVKSGNRMTMRSLSITPSERFEFRFTAFDSTIARTNPMAHFPYSPYARVVLGADTLPYYWKSNFFRWPSFPDKFEIYGAFGADTLSLIAQLPTGNLTFSSSMQNFRFGISGRSVSLGRFTCIADSTTPFALRLSSVADPGLWPGTFQGACKVRMADNPGTLASDSMLNLSGDFRFRLSGNPPLISPLWTP